jgi:predicted nucleic acid-binding protein
MRTVVADTSYWIALINRVDNVHQRAMAVSSQLGQFQTITSDMVLAEVLNYFAGRGSQLRGVAVSMVNIITTGANRRSRASDPTALPKGIRALSKAARQDLEPNGLCIIRDHGAEADS